MYKVYLYLYDLSNGMSRIYSPMFLGYTLEGIWHTSVVVHGKEYYFGQGIHYSNPSYSVYGQPVKKIDMGETEVDEEIFRLYLDDLSHTKYSDETYHLLDQNCNHFTNDVIQFLTGKEIDDEIVKLPEKVMATPFGQVMQEVYLNKEIQMIRPIIEDMFGPSMINNDPRI